MQLYATYSIKTQPVLVSLIWFSYILWYIAPGKKQITIDTISNHKLVRKQFIYVVSYLSATA